MLAGCHKPAEPSPAPGVVVEGDLITFPKDNAQLAMIQTVDAVHDTEGKVGVTGHLAWDESRTARVAAPVAGRITHVHAEVGQTVRAGASLATVVSADVAAAHAEWRRAQTDRNLAEKSHARVRELADAGILPTKDVQQADAELARSKAEQDRARARLALLTKEPHAGADGQFALTAPVSGVIVARRAAVGLEVQPEQPRDAADALFTISDPLHLWVILDVQERLISRVKPGEQMKIDVSSMPGEQLYARVEQIADFVDPETRTIKVRASIDNPTRRLKAAMFVTAQVEVEKLEGVRVPSNAVYLQGDKYFVFTQKGDGQFKRQMVSAEEAGLGFMRIREGIKAGDSVVSDGALLLQQLVNTRALTPAKKVKP